ncbi:MAG TPA: hypothetical protein VFK80_03045, partial [Limnochordia bacterium]|nr:hypothetical protein [Limnochordia bacterium]
GPGGVLTHRDGQIVIAREGGRDEVIPVERNDDRVGLFGDFTRCVRTDDTPWITADDGRAALEIAVAVLESVETGRAVELQVR